MYRVSYCIGKSDGDDVWLHRDCKNLCETFETMKLLVWKEKLMYPDQERGVDDFYEAIARMSPHANGRMTKWENFLFTIEVIEENKQ